MNLPSFGPGFNRWDGYEQDCDVLLQGPHWGKTRSLEFTHQQHRRTSWWILWFSATIWPFVCCALVHLLTVGIATHFNRTHLLQSSQARSDLPFCVIRSGVSFRTRRDSSSSIVGCDGRGRWSRGESAMTVCWRQRRLEETDERV